MKFKTDMNFLFFSPFLYADHVQFEASVLKQFRRTYPSATMIIIGNQIHLKELFNLIPDTWIKIISCNTKNSFFLNLFILFQAFRLKKTIQIHLACDSTMSYLWYFISLIMPLTLVFMHGYWKSRRTFYWKFLHLFLLKIFILSHPKTKLIVLGEWIFRNIQRDISLSPREKNVFNWMHHPYFYSSNHDSQVVNWNIFSFPGQSSKIFKWINQTTFRAMQKHIVNLGGICIHSGDSFLEYSKYIQLFIKSSYVIILYSANSYDFRCSWIFIEAIAYRKPIICLHSSMTNSFFSTFGDIGYQCTDFDDMKNCIKWILENPNSYIYNQQIINLTKASQVVCSWKFQIYNSLISLFLFCYQSYFFYLQWWF